MENNARSGVRRVQAEMSFILIFPSVVRTEKMCIVFWVLDQRADYINRSSKRLCLINCFDRSSKRGQNRSKCFAHRTNLLHTSGGLIDNSRFIDESSRKSESLKSMQYYFAHRKTEHCKYMSRKTIAFWTMQTSSCIISSCQVMDKAHVSPCKFWMLIDVRHWFMLVFLTGVLSHPLLSLHLSWNMDAASSITLMSYQSICSMSLTFLPNMSCCHRYMHMIFLPLQWIGVMYW